MSEYADIFSATIPGQKKQAAKRVKSPAAQVAEPAPAKVKRKYTRKAASVDADQRILHRSRLEQDILDRAEEMPRVSENFALGKVVPTPEQPSFSSRGLEYLGALERLLALIGEPQRTRLVDFIVDNNIV